MESTDKELLNKMRQEYLQNRSTLEGQYDFGPSKHFDDFDDFDDCDEELDVNRLRLDSHT